MERVVVHRRDAARGNDAPRGGALDVRTPGEGDRYGDGEGKRVGDDERGRDGDDARRALDVFARAHQAPKRRRPRVPRHRGGKRGRRRRGGGRFVVGAENSERNRFAPREIVDAVILGLVILLRRAEVLGRRPGKSRAATKRTQTRKRRRATNAVANLKSPRRFWSARSPPRARRGGARERRGKPERRPRRDNHRRGRRHDVATRFEPKLYRSERRVVKREVRSDEEFVPLAGPSRSVRDATNLRHESGGVVGVVVAPRVAR